jgi:Cu2+-exporting ATPase
LEGIIEGKEIKVVGPNYLKEQNIKIAETIDEFTGTVVYV